MIKSKFENEKKIEGYAIIDGTKKDLTPALLVELKAAKAAGKIKDQVNFWINDNGAPIQIG
jgi:hypothetical protein